MAEDRSFNERLWLYDEKKEDIDSYLERWEARFRRKKLDDDADKIDLFMEECGPSMYSALRTLARPLLVKDMEWDALSLLIKQHWGPVRNKHLERRKFRNRIRQAGESFNDYALALRELSCFCQFTDLKEALIEQFLNGLGDNEVLKHLTSKTNLVEFKEYVAEAYSYQASLRVVNDSSTGNVNALHAHKGKSKSKPKDNNNAKGNASNSTISTSNQNSNSQPKPKKTANSKGNSNANANPNVSSSNTSNNSKKLPPKPCKGCGAMHYRNHCPFKDAPCHNCNIKGHIAKVCQQQRSNTGAISSEFNTAPIQADSLTSNWTPGSMYVVSAELNNIQQLASQAGKKIFVDITVDNLPLKMQLDCGAVVSIIPKEIQEERWPKGKLREPELKLMGPPLHPINVLGVLDVQVQCVDGVRSLPLYVANGPFPTLLGNNWIPFMDLDYNQLLKDVPQPQVCLIERSTLQEWSTEFPYCFGQSAGPIQGYEARVRLKENAVPKFIPHRDPPIPLRVPTEKELERMEKAQFLRPILYSKWASPHVIVPKKQGQEVRICGDYSATVNPQVETAYYPIPKIDHLSLVHGKYFAKLDMKDAYCHVKIAEEDQEILTLSTHVGLKAVMRLLFGLSFAPAEFMSIVSQILGELQSSNYERMFLYLDDLLLCADTKEGLLALLKQVLTVLNKHRVQINVMKSQFMEEQIDFLGFRLSAAGLRPDPAKVQKIQQSQFPKNLEMLLCFLGMVTFYHKFIKNMSTIAAPLHALRSKPWQWTRTEHDASQLLIQALNDEVLIPYSLDLPLRLTCDASPVGAGAVLSHVVEGEERPIAFASKTFTSAEQGYSQIEREAAAVIFAVKKFEHYLYGRQFELITDNSGLFSLLNPKHQRSAVAIGRIQRWYLLLSNYNFKVTHRRSSEIPHADCLSRIPCQDESPIEEVENYISFVDYLPITAFEVRTETAKDPILSRVVSFVQFGWPDTPAEPDLEVYKRKGNELTLEVGCLLWGSRVIIPKSLRPQILHMLHAEHFGESKIKMLARSHVYWPKIDEDIEDMAKQCGVCRVTEVKGKPIPVIPWTWSTVPWRRIFVDFAKRDGVTFMIVVDHHSKYPFVEIMKKTTTEDVIEYLRVLFAQYGFPNELVADNGPPFDAHEFQNFLANNHVQLKHSPVAHPASNGQAEVMVKTFKKTLMKQLLDPETCSRSLQHQVSAFLLKYRTTPHMLTNCTPAELFLKRQVRTHFSELNPLTNLASRIQAKQKKISEDRGGIAKEFMAGDLVWVRVSLGPRKFIYKPAQVLKKMSGNSYDIDLGGRVRHTSAEHLYRRDPRADPIDLLELPKVYVDEQPSQDFNIPPDNPVPTVDVSVPNNLASPSVTGNQIPLTADTLLHSSTVQTPGTPRGSSTPVLHQSKPATPMVTTPTRSVSKPSGASKPSPRALFNPPVQSTTSAARPKRNIKLPVKFGDYKMYH